MLIVRLSVTARPPATKFTELHEDPAGGVRQNHHDNRFIATRIASSDVKEDVNNTKMPGVNISELVGVVSGVTCLAAIGLFAYVIWRCRSTRRTCCDVTAAKEDAAETDDDEALSDYSLEYNNGGNVATGSSGSPLVPCVQDLTISQSTPDLIGGAPTTVGLMLDSAHSDGGGCGRTGRLAVVKQKTLPSVSHRHMWFHRLFHRWKPGTDGTDGNSCTPAASSCCKPHNGQLVVLSPPGVVGGPPRPVLQTVSAPAVPPSTLRLQAGLVQPRTVGPPAANVPPTVDAGADARLGGADSGKLFVGLALDWDGAGDGGAGREKWGSDSGTGNGSGGSERTIDRTSVGGDGRGGGAGSSPEDGVCLVVRIIRADGLPSREFSGTSDPYIKVHLLPDRRALYQTKLRRRTLCPHFDERFVIHVTSVTSRAAGHVTTGPSVTSLRDRQLHFGVYDFDRYSRHDLIATAVLEPEVEWLNSPEGRSGKERVYELLLQPGVQDGAELGELMLSLRYLPTAGRLTVTVLKARNLRATDFTGKSDPFVKVALVCQGQRINKKKTSVKRATLCPVYNEAMMFDVPQESIEEVSLIVEVIHHDSCGGSELMGACATGRPFSGSGRDHWFTMLERPRRAIAQWYKLVEHVPSATAT